MGIDARLLVEPRFMRSERFGLGNIPREPLVTIKSVKQQTEKGKTGDDEVWGLLTFAEPWARPLKIITTTLKCLLAMFNEPGDYDSSKWIGKRLVLYAMPGVFFGKRGTAVRFRGSPDIKQTISVSIQKFGGGFDVYDLEAIDLNKRGAPKASTPYERMWGAWKAAGLEKDAAGFQALIRSATNKASASAVTDADVAVFEAALKAKLDGPPPPMSEADQAAALEHERAEGSTT